MSCFKGRRHRAEGFCEGGRRRAESGIVSLRSSCAHETIPSTFPLPPSSFRLGVTLIELLITVTIISILAATFLGVSNSAMEGAREARTKTIIGKIHNLLMEKWASYATRRVDVNPVLTQFIDTGGFSGIVRGQMLADMRLLATREQMKLEMPDRWSDIIGDTVANAPPTAADNAFRNPVMLSRRPALTSTYLRRYRALDPSDLDALQANQGAECLYLIVMLSTADGEARTLFSAQDIGDTDGDGAKEFLDGWGRPIEFIRWPAGFTEQSDLMGGPLLADDDHDSYDPFRRDQIGITDPDFNLYPAIGTPLVTVQSAMNQLRNRNGNPVLKLPDGSTSAVSAFRQVPLIYSTGPDGFADIDNLASAGFMAGLDPYVIDSSEQYFEFGAPSDLNGDGDDNSLDNIHNHLQDNR